MTKKNTVSILSVNKYLNMALQQRGFTIKSIRFVMVSIILASLFLFCTGLLSAYFIAWPFWLGVGALLSAWNFYSLASFVQQRFMPNHPGQFIAFQLIRSNLRLFITGIIVYISLVECGASPFALVAGLSLTVIMVPLLLLSTNKLE